MFRRRMPQMAFEYSMFIVDDSFDYMPVFLILMNAS